MLMMVTSPIESPFMRSLLAASKSDCSYSSGAGDQTDRAKLQIYSGRHSRV
jgi:hypothetical protein